MSSSKFFAPMLFAVALLVAGSSMAAEKSSGFECPKLSKKLTAQEVFDGRMAALEAGNLDLAFCYYAEDAVAMMPGSVIQGRDQVKAAFVNFGAIFGGQIPRPSTVTIQGDVVMATFAIDGPIASITDGADTFIIRNGRIQTQVVHATLTFHTQQQ